jgi:hypothetical protein
MLWAIYGAASGHTVVARPWSTRASTVSQRNSVAFPSWGSSIMIPLRRVSYWPELTGQVLRSRSYMSNGITTTICVAISRLGRAEAKVINNGISLKQFSRLNYLALRKILHGYGWQPQSHSCREFLSRPIGFRFSVLARRPCCFMQSV